MTIDGNDLELLVCEALLFTNDISSAEFEVEEADGIIKLKGIVGSDTDRMIAEDLARLQPGVVDVINDLKIS